ncbi:MAG: chemotaxis-specific protein-glutamate methyltransferase CheB [Myxococcales bacterium]
MSSRKKIRVLVVDDSAYNRRAITEMLESAGDIAVVATASDGEEGLKQAIALKPDVITLDLEMPRMNGFTFLRLLMARAPIPVIVISGYARRADVFKAMELGAIDFVAKPQRHFSPETASVRSELIAKISAVRLLKPEAFARQERGGDERPPRVVVVGASTGGPPALQRLLSALPGDLSLCIAIAQHMPPRFTKAFAERLDRVSAFEVVEAKAGDELAPGRALIAPGGHTMRIVQTGSVLRCALAESGPSQKYSPSIDALFESAAAVAGARGVGILLTGMGSDGRDGMLRLRQADALTIAESEESAVIFGMPKEAINAGAAAKVLSLESIISELIRLGRGRA